MPTRVLLEGPAIEPLLAQVRQQYGPTARIISADKIRTGGFAGFFARQRYELSVEVEDQPADQPTEERHEERAATSAPGAAPERPDRVRRPVANAVDAVDTVDDGLLALVEASQDRYHGLAAPTRPLAGVTAGTHGTTAPSAAATPRAGLVSTANPGFAEVLAGLRGNLVDDGAVEEHTSAARIAVPTRAERTVRAFHPPATTVTGGPANGGTINGGTINGGVVDGGPAGTGPHAAGLVALGVPAALTRGSTAADPYQAAMDALEDLPEPPKPPNHPGDVLVVAGELAHALPVAQQAAIDLHLDPKKIGLVAPSAAGTGIHPSRRISGPADAERRARRMHRADVPHVVVMDAPVSADDDGWRRDVCDALGATAVWVVVDATRKTADSARQLAVLGEVDAVALHGARATADPASALGLPAPVAVLDGKPATAHVWASLLSERLVRASQQARRGRRGRRKED